MTGSKQNGDATFPQQTSFDRAESSRAEPKVSFLPPTTASFCLVTYGRNAVSVLSLAQPWKSNLDAKACRLASFPAALTFMQPCTVPCIRTNRYGLREPARGGRAMRVYFRVTILSRE